MTTKAQRARKAAAAARRIPLVGTAVVLLPAAEAASAAFGSNLSNIANIDAWRSFLNGIKVRYTGVNDTGQLDGVVLAATYIPIAVYIVAKKLGGKQIGKVFSKVHLRF